TLVIVADPEAGAIRVYRSVGFRDAETQIAFQRPPYAGGEEGRGAGGFKGCGAAEAGDGAAADPDGAAVVAGDVDSSATAHGGALAGDVGGGGAAGLQQPAGQRRVQAAGHRVLAEAAEGRAEGPHLERLRGTGRVGADDADVEVGDAGADGQHRVGAGQQDSHPAGAVVDPLGVDDVGRMQVEHVDQVEQGRLGDRAGTDQGRGREGQGAAVAAQFDQAGFALLDHGAVTVRGADAGH